MRANMCIKRPFLQKWSVRIATHGGKGYKKSDLPSIPLTNFSSLAKMSPVKKEPHFLCDRNLAEAPRTTVVKGKVEHSSNSSTRRNNKLSLKEEKREGA